MTEALPFSQACENNKHPILDVLQRHLLHTQSLLEIGGGTGQHAVFFAAQFPQLKWQSSEYPPAVDTLNLRLCQSSLANLPAAIAIDVNAATWNCAVVDAIYSANCLHIVSTTAVEKFFAGVGRNLPVGGLLLVYGPFKYRGEFTTDSNAQFDLWLKSRNPLSGVRDFEWVNELAENIGLVLLEDNSMPANNQMLVWRKTAL